MELTITRRDGSTHTVLFDAADAEPVLARRWWIKRCPGGLSYALSHIPRVKGSPHRSLPMHALLMGLRDVDHINHNGLDNRRANLRPATRSQQMGNMLPKGGTSQYKGVYWDKRVRAWHAQIRVDYHRRNLGLFVSEIEAAGAYDDAALEAWGEYALVNFPCTADTVPAPVVVVADRFEHRERQ